MMNSIDNHISIGDEDTAIIESPVRRRLVLAVMSLSLMMVMSAVSGLNVALPGIAQDTGASQTDLQWIVDAYTLVFAGLLLPAGALGDRFGRRLVLLSGLIIFGLAALLATLVTQPSELIMLRAMMGVGAALVMPTTLSVITTSFPPRSAAAPSDCGSASPAEAPCWACLDRACCSSGLTGTRSSR